MKRALRSIVSVLAGLIAGSVIIFLVELINAVRVEPPAPGSPPGAATEGLPTSAFALVLVGWFLGCALGSYTAARLSGSNRAAHAAAVTVLFLASAIFNLATLPHPLWMWPATVLAFVLGGVAGAKVGGAGRDPYLGELSMGPS